MKFYALEPHVDGTTKYEIGDPREADENEVKHLVELGVLSTEKPKGAKSEGAADRNKAEPAPSNKAK